MNRRRNRELYTLHTENRRRDVAKAFVVGLAASLVLLICLLQ